MILQLRRLQSGIYLNSNYIITIKIKEGIKKYKMYSIYKLKKFKKQVARIKNNSPWSIPKHN